MAKVLHGTARPSEVSSRRRAQPRTLMGRFPPNQQVAVNHKHLGPSFLQYNPKKKKTWGCYSFRITSRMNRSITLDSKFPWELRGAWPVLEGGRLFGVSQSKARLVMNSPISCPDLPHVKNTMLLKRCRTFSNVLL